MSEPGSVPDGETLQNADVARLKRSSWDTDNNGGHPRKRYDNGFRVGSGSDVLSVPEA